MNGSPPIDTAPACGYPVAPRKFWFMMILTARLFAVYWAYKNFLALDPTPAKRPKILAALNGLFFIFRFKHLMNLIETAGDKHGVPIKFPRNFYMLCLLFLIPVVGIALNYFEIPFGWVLPIVLTTLVIGKANEALVRINEHINPRVRLDTDLTRLNYVFVAIVLAVTFFYPEKYNPINLLEEAKYKQYCRWINDDPTNKREQEIKGIRIKAMDTFWKFFKIANMDLFNPDRKEAVSKIFHKDLENVHPNLGWEVREQPNRQGTKMYEFTIYSRQNPDLLPMIRSMIARAPKYSNCKYYCYKQPVPSEELKNALEISSHISIKKFKARCHLSRDNRITVELTSPDIEDENGEEDLESARSVVEMVLGQEHTFSWLGPVKIKKGDANVPVESAARELKTDFELLKQVAINKLPSKFYYELDSEEFLKAFSLDAIDESMNDSVPESGFSPNMLLAITNFPFSSQRFSRNGEKFVMLVTQTKGDKETINNFAKDTDILLLQQKAGTAFWSLAEDHKMRVLYGIKDFGKTRKIIQDTCDKYKFSHQSWLLYLDSEMDNEEIRLYPDTKPYEVE